jgi:cation:H+ antiporter
MTLLMFIGGLVLLVVGAEALVRGASKLAASFGIPALVVGLTIVAFGTSSPELAVSIQSAQAGKVDVALGNVVGSNIFNVLFILGICAVVAPLVVAHQIIRQEVPIMIGASILLLVLAMDGTLSRMECVLLLAIMVAYTVFLIVQGRRESRADAAALVAAGGSPTPTAPAKSWDDNRAVQLILIAVGLALLVQGSNWRVSSAITFAKSLGVSELVIGLTIVAAGTSLPEVAASILATLRGEREIAIGNVVGSNTFNILGVLGASGLAGPSELVVPAAILNFDGLVMLAVALACIPVFRSGGAINRWEGILFLGYYAAYTIYLIMASQQHDALPAFSAVMLSFVIPITIVSLVVVSVRPKT